MKDFFKKYKFVIVILFLLLLSFFCLIFIIVANLYRDRNKVRDPQPLPEITITQQPTTKIEEIENDKVKIEDLKISFTTPTKNSSFDPKVKFKTGVVGEEPEYLENPLIFKAGKVLEGTMYINDSQTDLSNFDYYTLFVYNCSVDCGIEGFEKIHFLSTKNQETTIVFVTEYMDHQYFFDLSITKTYDEFPYNNISGDQASGKNNYKFYTRVIPIVFDELDTTKVDEVATFGIYELNTDFSEKIKNDFFEYDFNSLKYSLYTKTFDGFLLSVSYIPSIIDYPINPESLFGPIPQVKWLDGKENKGEYDYVSIGGCFGNAIEVDENMTIDKLTITGKAFDGSDIYEVTDPNDEYRTKIYEEYIIEQYKYNSITEDDENPFDYRTYLSYHPVFYYQDPFGRFIKFASRDFVFTGGCAKPAIYLYPEEKTEITLSVDPTGVLTFTAPRYEDGWNVIANPNGSLLNKSDSHEYEYLWWESKTYSNINVPTEGFVVNKNELNSFFDTKLSQFGLNQKEIADFEEYWIEKMLTENTDYFFISFLFNNEVDQIARIIYSIEPDTEMRIFMLYKPIESNLEIVEQEIPRQNRDGYVSVEWGGAKI